MTTAPQHNAPVRATPILFPATLSFPRDVHPFRLRKTMLYKAIISEPKIPHDLYDSLTFHPAIVTMSSCPRAAYKWSSPDMFSLRDPLRSMKPAQVGSTKILERVDSLIDELLNDSDLSSSSLASILMAARESVRDGYHVALARRIWDAHNDLQLRDCPGEPEIIERLGND